MERLKVIAFTHKSTELDNLGRFFIEQEEVKSRLEYVKSACGISEIFYLSTCNRVEFTFVTESELTHPFLQNFFHALNSGWSAADIEWNISHCQKFSGEDAARHLFHVAASLDSLVVGEREIIAQFRKSYDQCQKDGLTGDFLRLVDKATVKSAKEVFTHTKIAEKSVSVVFLAYQKLKSLHVDLNARFLIIGAGTTNSTMAKYLKKHGFTNFAVFNRSLENAQKLAKELEGEAYSLEDLQSYNRGFDVIISCTGAQHTMVTNQLYTKLVGDDQSKKVLIDLAIPYDIDREIANHHTIHLIEIEGLKGLANKNLIERQNEVEHANTIIEENIIEFRNNLKHRRVEIAMQDVPKKIKEIRKQAVDSVFAKEIETLDANSREVLEKVLAYMEKKCISVPMVLAKDILIGSESN